MENRVEDNRAKGSRGESLACDYLSKLGYNILKRNFYFGKHGEIDIIAEDGLYLVFIEVKSRYSDEFGDPLLSITSRKQRSLRRAAEGYLYVNKITDKDCRFDVIIVRFDKNNAIEHIKAAF